VVQRRLDLLLERVLDPAHLDRKALALARLRRLPLPLAQLRELRLQRLRPLPDDAAQPLRLPAQLLLGQRREPLRDLVDLRDQRLKPLDLTVVPRPEQPAYHGLQHWISDVHGLEGRRIPASGGRRGIASRRPCTVHDEGPAIRRGRQSTDRRRAGHARSPAAPAPPYRPCARMIASTASGTRYRIGSPAATRPRISVAEMSTHVTSSRRYGSSILGSAVGNPGRDSATSSARRASSCGDRHVWISRN